MNLIIGLLIISCLVAIAGWVDGWPGVFGALTGLTVYLLFLASFIS